MPKKNPRAMMERRLTIFGQELEARSNRHGPDFFFHLSGLDHGDCVPRTTIKKRSIRPLAGAFLATDAENRIHLNPPEWRMVFIGNPEHAVFNRAVFDTSRRPGASRATFRDDR